MDKIKQTLEQFAPSYCLSGCECSPTIFFLYAGGNDALEGFFAFNSYCSVHGAKASDTWASTLVSTSVSGMYMKDFIIE